LTLVNEKLEQFNIAYEFFIPSHILSYLHSCDNILTMSMIVRPWSSTDIDLGQMAPYHGKSLFFSEIKKPSVNTALRCSCFKDNITFVFMLYLLLGSYHLLRTLSFTLVDVLQLTSVRVNNVFNEFMMLANTQFVENVSVV
jgi:hypothetical protein